MLASGELKHPREGASPFHTLQTNSQRDGGDLGWRPAAMKARVLFQTRSAFAPKILDSSIAQHWKHPVWWSRDTEDIWLNPHRATSPAVLQDSQQPWGAGPEVSNEGRRRGIPGDGGTS